MRMIDAFVRGLTDPMMYEFLGALTGFVIVLCLVLAVGSSIYEYLRFTSRRRGK